MTTPAGENITVNKRGKTSTTEYVLSVPEFPELHLTTMRKTKARVHDVEGGKMVTGKKITTYEIDHCSMHVKITKDHLWILDSIADDPSPEVRVKIGEEEIWFNGKKPETVKLIARVLREIL